MNSILEVPFQELDVLEAYLHGEDVNHQAFFKERQIPDLDYPSQIEIAVAQIVLHRIQGRLPQWLCTDAGFHNHGSHRPIECTRCTES